MSRRTLQSGPARAEGLERRTLFSSGVNQNDAVALYPAGVHGAGCGCGICSGDRYVAPAVQPRKSDAKRIDPTGLSTAADDNGMPMTDLAEMESNNTPATANAVGVTSTTNTITASMSSSSDLD